MLSYTEPILQVTFKPMQRNVLIVPFVIVEEP